MLTVTDVYNDAVNLKPQEQAELVDKLLRLLDEPDKAINEAWQEEAEARIDAYEQGRISSVALSDVLAKYSRA